MRGPHGRARKQQAGRTVSADIDYLPFFNQRRRPCLKLPAILSV